ncbi:c1b96934-75ae-45c2-b987-130c87a0a77d [Thermothielavioides terrestris]|uniref:Probable glucan endo-1,3-beta-glucosidase eglC n=1 Tax=Thermothielavioides terrestris TaxID=2587410 RepID=A0A3S4C836_9PEZI|nr:c1b96934-75ae-45c2-b987-130c87a0a77d [Thermothielavioides terrestris]
MRSTQCLAALTATISVAQAVYQGFNYGAFFQDQSPKTQADFEAEFTTAQHLVGAPAGGFTSARLYTTIQWGTAQDPIAAIPAAIATNTSLLLGIWCSAGDAVVTNELAALHTAIATYGTRFTDLVVGISVGSEDLYRASAIGIANGAGAGASPAAVAGYIRRVRAALAGTALAGAPVGHTDTWTAWVDAGSKEVVDAADFVGVNAFPYWQSTQANGIDRAKELFDDALARTRQAVAGGGGGSNGTKPVWITETGFPVSGHTSNEAVPSVENAKRFWDEVGCPLFGRENVWWYILRDAGKGTPEPSFGVVGSGLSTTPLFDISCKGTEEAACAAS